MHFPTTEPETSSSRQAPLRSTRSMVRCRSSFGGVRSRAARHVDVLFLDADVEEPEHWRLVSRKLYGGDQSLRLRQELVLGQGGDRYATQEHGDDPAAPQRGTLRHGACRLAGSGQTEEAIRARCHFTTHTPVAAGHDRFGAGLWQTVCTDTFRGVISSHMGDGELNMSHLAAHYAQKVNGVSQTNAEVAEPLFRASPLRAIAASTTASGACPRWRRCLIGICPSGESSRVFSPTPRSSPMMSSLRRAMRQSTSCATTPMEPRARRSDLIG